MSTAVIPEANINTLQTDPVHSAAQFTLYSDFIAERARLLVDALGHNVSDAQKLLATALLSRIQRSSSSGLQTAEEIIKTILSTPCVPDSTIPQPIGTAGTTTQW